MEAASVCHGLAFGSAGLRTNGCRDRSEAFELPAEIIKVRKLAVDRRKPDVCDVVQLLEFTEDRFADHAGWYFRAARFEQSCFNALNEGIYLPFTDGAFGERHPEFLAKLVGVELFAAVVLLHDHQADWRQSFVRGEAAIADGAVAPTTNGIAATQFPAVDNTRVAGVAIGAAHERSYLGSVNAR